MAKQDGEPDKVVKLWMKRLKAADKAREEWEGRYEVAKCREYWTGIQRSDPGDDEDRKAVINRILPTIRTRIPSLYFYHPFARVTASPSKADTPAATVDDSAQLLQDTVNSLLRDPRCGLKEQTLLGLKEAHWAFAAIEVGFSADYIDNPALKDAAPPLKEEKDTEGVSAKPAQVAKEEWFWTRRIPARQVLVSAPECTLAAENDWIGYWEYQNVEDLKKAPAYSNTSDLKGSSTEDKRDEAALETSAQDVKVYKVWDQRAKCRYVFAEGGKKPLLKAEYKRLPLFFLRFETEPDRFRPIPPIHNWLGRQDQYNTAAESLRIDLKTRVRRFTVDENGVLPEELEKFEANDPNTWIKRRASSGPDVVSPIVQPAMSGEMVQMMQIAKAEFDEVSGIGAEARQQASSDTATQAAIMNQRQNISDTYDRSLVATWLSEIAYELMQLAIDKMTLPRVVQINSDPFSPAFQMDAQKIAQQWQLVTLKQLQNADGGVDWDVSVDIESLSPVSEQEKQAQWMNMLQVISTHAPMLALSPELLKRTLDLSGIKNAKDQAAIGQALAMQAQIQAAMLGQKMGAPPGVAPMPGGPGGGGGPAPKPPQMIPGPPEGMVQ